MMQMKAQLVRAAAMQTLKFQKHSPTILFGAGIIGFVATTVLAGRATLKLSEVLDETQAELAVAKSTHDNPDYQDRYTDDDYSKDVTTIYIRTALEVTKLYGPVVIVGVASIAALTKSHQILNTRNASLTAAYATLDKAFRQYRKRVENELGPNKERELYQSPECIAYDVDTDGNVIGARKIQGSLPSVYARVFDQLNKHWKNTPEYNQIFIRAAQNQANDMLKARGHLFLNEVYDALGFERTTAGSVVGWVLGSDGDNYVDFGIYDAHNQAVNDFVNGYEHSVWLDFNVDGIVNDKIERVHR